MSVRIRLFAAFGALGAGAAAVVVVGGMLSGALTTPGASPASPSASTAPPPTSTPPAVHVPPGFPAPPANAVVLAREAGPNVLAVAVAPGAVQVSILGQNGVGVSGAEVRVDAARAIPCGRGCYRAHPRPGALDVVVRTGGQTTTWRPSLPRDAPAAAQLVARATAAYKALKSLAWHDVLGSNAHLKVATEWQATAPDRLAYQVRKGPKAVVIGDTRWDKFAPNAPWQKTQAAEPIAQPQPFWASAVDAHVIGSTTFAGRRVTEVSFFDPRTPGWYRILVEPRTLRTVHMDMYATAHFMHDTYFGFDTTPVVMPPNAG